MTDSTQTSTDRLLIVEPDGGDAAWMDVNRITIPVRGADTDGAYGLIVSRAPAGSSPPRHIHHTADEGIWMLEGRIRVVCGEDDFRLEKGGFTLLPRGVAHSFLVEQDAVMLGLMSPGGSEQFFLDGGEPVTGATPPAMDFAKAGAAAEKWECEFVGPPLTPES